MKAKNELKEIERLDERIQMKIDELYSLKTMAHKTTQVNDGMPHASGVSDKVGNLVSRYIDLEDEINREIDEFVDKKNAIINRINMLHNVVHIRLLKKKYIEYKSLELIAVEMQYSYDYTRRLHGLALLEFEKTKEVTK